MNVPRSDFNQINSSLIFSGISYVKLIMLCIIHYIIFKYMGINSILVV